MPKILSDRQDPRKIAIGNELRRLKKEDPQKLQQILSSMSEQEAEDILYDDEIWLRSHNQWIDLSSTTPVHILLGARGSGKGHCGAATVKRAVEKHDVKQMLFIAPASRDFRANIIPSVIDKYPPRHPNKPVWSPAKTTLYWPCGAEAVCISAESGEDAVRGLNLELFWSDETAFYDRHEGIVDMALLALRKEPSIGIITTSPKATTKIIEWYDRALAGDPMVKMYNATTYENMENLSRTFIDTVVKKYEGTTLGEQELEGKLILTNERALWQIATIVRNTVTLEELPEIVEVAIGLDPAVLSKASSSKGRTPDATGIIVSGMGADGNMYTLEGYTGSHTVESWTNRTALLFDKWRQKCKVSVVAEINVIGNDMIKMAFDKAGRSDVGAHIKPVFATQSKLQRALPYSLLAEQDKIKYLDGEYLKLLSTELTTYDGTGRSPNSLDAAVWSWSVLTPPNKRVTRSFELLI